MEKHDGSPARVCDVSAAGSSLLLSHKLEAGAPGLHPSHPHGSKHRGHYDDDECSDGSQEGAPPGQVHEGSLDLPASFGGAGIRSGRGSREDLRPLRPTMGLGPEEQYDLGHAEGLALGGDPSEPLQGDAGQPESGRKGQKARRTCRTPSTRTSASTSGTGTLSRLFATVLHALASICAYKDTNTSGILRTTEANAGTSQAQEFATASWPGQLDSGTPMAWNGLYGIQRVGGADERGPREWTQEDAWHLWHETNLDHLEGSEPDELFDPNNHIPDVDAYGEEL